MKINFVIPALVFLVGYNNNSSTKKLFNDKEQSFEVLRVSKQIEDSLISLLPKMKANSLDCSADTYWKIIKRGKPSIPLLIESLTDTTMTNVYNQCKRSKLNVGEVSYFALEEIADFPAFSVTHIQFDLIDNNGCWNFLNYLFNNRNKKEYQRMMRHFYKTSKYIFVNFNKKELSKCRKQYNIIGNLKLKQEE